MVQGITGRVFKHYRGGKRAKPMPNFTTPFYLDLLVHEVVTDRCPSPNVASFHSIIAQLSTLEVLWKTCYLPCRAFHISFNEFSR